MEIVGLLSAIVALCLYVLKANAERKADPSARDRRIDEAVSKGGDALGGVLHRTLDRMRRHRPNL